MCEGLLLQFRTVFLKDVGTISLKYSHQGQQHLYFPVSVGGRSLTSMGNLLAPSCKTTYFLRDMRSLFLLWIKLISERMVYDFPQCVPKLSRWITPVCEKSPCPLSQQSSGGSLASPLYCNSLNKIFLVYLIWSNAVSALTTLSTFAAIHFISPTLGL